MTIIKLLNKNFFLKAFLWFFFKRPEVFKALIERFLMFFLETFQQLLFNEFPEAFVTLLQQTLSSTSESTQWLHKSETFEI